uniref:MalT-like TPR region domain-containing protein n=1 Tax=Manihot esculenta TaxID=3983 RepID=A0A2C9VLW1_MANES
MAASLLSSPSLCNHRINQAFVHLHSSHQTGMKCNFKLYMVPAQAISRYCTLRTFTSVASLNVEVACEGNSSAASSPSDLLRSKTLLQSPSNASDGMNDLERQLQELYDEVKAMTLMGNKDDAVDLLQANYGVVKEQINAGSRGIEEAATLEQFLSAFMNKVVESLKDDEPLLDSVLIHMGSMYSALGKFQSSMVVYKRAIGVLESKHGNVEEAIDLYKKDLQLIKDTNYIALDDSIMEKMRIDLAELLHVVGRGKEGRELLEECLLISERSKGKDHPSSVSHLINLATSYSQSKNFVEAERLLRISLELMAKTVSPEDQSITFPMLHLAVTLYHLNRDEEAEQLALKVLRIREKAFEKDSSSWGGSRLFDIDSDQIKEGRC